jgi:hypothetical protein
MNRLQIRSPGGILFVHDVALPYCDSQDKWTSRDRESVHPSAHKLPRQLSSGILPSQKQLLPPVTPPFPGTPRYANIPQVYGVRQIE